jgi:hypothetical protein
MDVCDELRSQVVVVGGWIDNPVDEGQDWDKFERALQATDPCIPWDHQDKHRCRESGAENSNRPTC